MLIGSQVIMTIRTPNKVNSLSYRAALATEKQKWVLRFMKTAREGGGSLLDQSIWQDSEKVLG